VCIDVGFGVDLQESLSGCDQIHDMCCYYLYSLHDMWLAGAGTLPHQGNIVSTVLPTGT